MIIGIDFGTTNSCVSVFNEKSGKIEIVNDNSGNNTYPTCLYFDKETDDILFGEVAYNLLKSKNNGMYIGNIIHNIKRLVGIDWNSLSNNNNQENTLQKFFKESGIKIIEKQENKNHICIQLTYNRSTKNFTVSDIIKLYLRYLKHLIYQNYGSENEKCTNLKTVITVPAYFTDIQREVILDCCKTVGFDILRVINEPTSAILAYTWEMNKINKNFIENMGDKIDNYLVLDCGGGTTDLSLINVDYEEMIFQVKTVEGDNFLGGQDLTNNMVKWVCNKIALVDPTTKILNTILKECERAKAELSYNQNTVINLECINDKDHMIQLSRTKFVEINEVFFSKIRELLKKINGDKMNKVDKILFVGGSTNIPYFVEMCNQIFGHEIQIINTLDKNTAVSIGATVQGIILSGILETIDETNKFTDTLLLDIIPMSIGVKTIGDIMSVIIPKGTPIPCERTEYFSNSEDYVNSIDIDIYQGIRKFVKDNFYLGSFVLENLDDTKTRGQIHIKMVLRVDENGIIRAKAEQKSGGGADDEGVIKEIVVSKIVNNKNCKDKEKSKEEQFEKDIEDEFLKIDDTERANKILAKLELYDSFKFLLTRFHEIRENLITCDEKYDLNSGWKRFQIDELNNLFNDTFNIIMEWENYNKDILITTKISFEKRWHEIIYNLTN